MHDISMDGIPYFPCTMHAEIIPILFSQQVARTGVIQLMKDGRLSKSSP